CTTCEPSGTSRWTARHSSHSSAPELYRYIRSPISGVRWQRAHVSRPATSSSTPRRSSASSRSGISRTGVTIESVFGASGLLPPDWAPDCVLYGNPNHFLYSRFRFSCKQAINSFSVTDLIEFLLVLLYPRFDGAAIMSPSR